MPVKSDTSVTSGSPPLRYFFRPVLPRGLTVKIDGLCHLLHALAYLGYNEDLMFDP